MLWIHIAAGLIAIVAGFVALHVRKGGPTHVASGRAFAVAMLAMTLSAGLIASLLRPNPGNTVAAGLTLYLVATAWLAVRIGPERARPLYLALTTFAIGLGGYDLALVRVAWQAPGRLVDGIPAAALIMFGVVTLIAVIGDLRLLRRGRLQGPSRILRHLWRMGFALWIAALSFFLGQADEFPIAVRQSGVLFLPPLVVTASLLFWVLRQGWAVLRAKSRRAPQALAATGAQ